MGPALFGDWALYADLDGRPFELNLEAILPMYALPSPRRSPGRISGADHLEQCMDAPGILISIRVSIGEAVSGRSVA